VRIAYADAYSDGHDHRNTVTHADMSTGRQPRAVDTGCTGSD
jgi:hypothetical protein